LANRFIVFEGIDGAGTTTQSKMLADYYEKKGFWDKEPTDGDFGQMIRGILKNKTEINPITLLQLFLADRSEHQKTLQTQLLTRNVVLDRYLVSTLAYQGIYFEQEDLYRLNANFLKPERVFFMDIDPAAGLARKTGEKELFEELSLLSRIRDKYFTAIDLLKFQGWKIEFIDASLPAEVIHQQVLKTLGEV